MIYWILNKVSDCHHSWKWQSNLYVLVYYQSGIYPCDIVLEVLERIWATSGFAAHHTCNHLQHWMTRPRRGDSWAASARETWGGRWTAQDCQGALRSGAWTGIYWATKQPLVHKRSKCKMQTLTSRCRSIVIFCHAASSAWAEWQWQMQTAMHHPSCKNPLVHHGMLWFCPITLPHGHCLTACICFGPATRMARCWDSPRILHKQCCASDVSSLGTFI